MSLKCGIVGLPNVGKSTIFNALTKSYTAMAANYPFCTIEPNIGAIAVLDRRMDEIAKIAKTQKIIPAYLDFVDIAGIVKGASNGEGLGNKFLSHIREVDLILNVVRCFENDDITHVEGRIDPIADIELINTELVLADLESCDKQIKSTEKKAKAGDKDSKMKLDLLERIKVSLDNGDAAREVIKNFAKDEIALVKQFNFITTNPAMVICNIDEKSIDGGNVYVDSVRKYASEKGLVTTMVCGKIEEELIAIEDEAERREFLAMMNVKETGLEKVIFEAYKMLNLITYFTAGEKEVRAWTILNGTNAQEAAGVIHTDFAKGFIKAETISYNDYVRCNGEIGAKEAGLMRMEGRSYVVQDGDIMHFRFNV